MKTRTYQIILQKYYLDTPLTIEEDKLLIEALEWERDVPTRYDEEVDDIDYLFESYFESPLLERLVF